MNGSSINLKLKNLEKSVKVTPVDMFVVVVVVVLLRRRIGNG